MGTVTSPRGLLDISGNAGRNALFILNQTGTNANDYIFTASSSGVSKFVINNTGSVGIGTITPLATLDVNGTASAAGAFTLYSTPTIQSTANQTLTLGGNTTGNITLSPNNASGGKVNINGDILATSTQTTGTAFSYIANSIGSGTGLNLSVNGLNAGSGVLANVTSVYSGSVGNITGNLLNLSRSYTSGQAITFDAKSTLVIPSTQISTSFSHTVGSGSNRMIILGVATTFVNSNETVSTSTKPTFGSQEFIKITGCDANNNGNMHTEMWYLPDPASGTNTITVTLANNASSARWLPGVVSYSNVAQSTNPSDVFGTCAAATGNSQAPSVTVSSATNELVIDTVGVDLIGSENLTLTPGGSQTQRFNLSYLGALRGTYSEQAGAASVVE